MGLRQDARGLNEFLDVIQAKVYEARFKLIESGIQVTSSALMDIISGKESRLKILLTIFRSIISR